MTILVTPSLCSFLITDFASVRSGSSIQIVAAGLLRLPLGTFLAAATIGLGVKWAVYASAIYGALEAVESEEALSISVVLPLLALTVLLLVGAWVRRRVEANGQAANG